jgi:hypothetical protein
MIGTKIYDKEEDVGSYSMTLKERESCGILKRMH